VVSRGLSRLGVVRTLTVSQMFVLHLAYIIQNRSLFDAYNLIVKML
jgi:hypothetical protein